MKRFGLWLVPLAVIAGGVFLYDSFGIAWVGHTDLEIEFLVVDAHTGQTLEAAAIDVMQDEGGFCEDRSEQRFELFTDRNGQARRVCRSCMCFGTQSGLKFKDTYRVHLPYWHFRVSANGYESSEQQDLSIPRYIKQAKQVDPGIARLVVPVALRRHDK